MGWELRVQLERVVRPAAGAEEVMALGGLGLSQTVGGLVKSAWTGARGGAILHLRNGPLHEPVLLHLSYSRARQCVLGTWADQHVVFGSDWSWWRAGAR